MEYKKVDMHAYNLHMIKTSNFKRIFVKINFRKPIETKSATVALFSHNFYLYFRYLSKLNSYIYEYR